MTGSPRDALAATLDEQGAFAALHALRRAAEWATAVLSAAAASGDDAEALAALAELDPAMAGLARLSGVLPDVLTASFPGGPVEEQTRERSADLERLAAAVASQRSALDALSGTAAQVQAKVAEHERLRERVAELRRLERMAEVLGELQQQRQAIEDRLAALAAPVADVEGGLVRGCTDVIRLSQEHLARLEPQARDLLERANAGQARLAGVEQDMRQQEAALAAAAQRTAQLRELHETRAAALQAHAQADREVAEAIGVLTGAGDQQQRADAHGTPPGVRPVPHATGPAGEQPGGQDAVVTDARYLLDHIEAQLTALDEALARTLRARQPGPDTSAAAPLPR
jgi:DNA repair exonuclease SbcCD ATPase subunit